MHDEGSINNSTTEKKSIHSIQTSWLWL